MVFVICHGIGLSVPVPTKKGFAVIFLIFFVILCAPFLVMDQIPVILKYYIRGVLKGAQPLLELLENWKRQTDIWNSSANTYLDNKTIHFLVMD
jgi:hypothetical protein